MPDACPGTSQSSEVGPMRLIWLSLLAAAFLLLSLAPVAASAQTSQQGTISITQAEVLVELSNGEATTVFGTGECSFAGPLDLRPPAIVGVPCHGFPCISSWSAAFVRSTSSEISSKWLTGLVSPE
jgi:hypothetical protein